MPNGDVGWDQMSDGEKLAHICNLIRSLSDEIKAEALSQLNPCGPMSSGELKMFISSNEQAVRIDFGVPVGWIGLEKSRGIQFAITILEHCGAQFEPADEN
jgi:hypothetical protein